MQTLPHRAERPLISHQPSAQTSTSALRIVAIGDSLIYGFGDPEGGGWVERLRRQWMTPDSPSHALYNLGVRGDRVKQVARRMHGEFQHRGELRHRVPDFLILSVGLNDSTRLGRPNGKNFTEISEFEADMAHLLDQAQQLCPVLFVGMTPVDERKMPFSNCLYYNHADQHRYKEITRLACEQRQIPYLDIFEQWLNRGDQWCWSRLTQDGLHPNSSGYAALLQDFLQWQAARHWLGDLSIGYQ